MDNILKENPNRHVLFPIVYPDIMEFYQKHKSAFWDEREVDLSQDKQDWDSKLNDNTKFFIKNILSFFAASDGIVNENLAQNFLNYVQFPEAKMFYGFQIAMENIHSHSYSLLIDTYIKNESEKQECFNALQNNLAVQKKGNWALKFINDDSSFAEKLLAFIAVEGIFFSGSFASIFWLKSQGLMNGLGHVNELIFKDENLHCEFAIHLYNNYITEKPSNERVIEIINSALEIEIEFIILSLPVSLIGMDSKKMTQYVTYVTQEIFKKINMDPITNYRNPFDFMKSIVIERKTNFFEQRNADYQTGGTNSKELNINEDF